jgi:hypothetical protein
MSVTVAEAIAIEIEDRLNELVNGEELTDVVEVVRPTVYGGFTPKDNQIVITMGDTEEVPELFCPGNPPAICWETTYNVRCRVMPSENGTDTKGKLTSQFFADVIKAITTPQSTWHQFRGKAINARIGPISNNNSEVFEGVTVPIVVHYRTPENDPYTVRG